MLGLVSSRWVIILDYQGTARRSGQSSCFPMCVVVKCEHIDSHMKRWSYETPSSQLQLQNDKNDDYVMIQNKRDPRSLFHKALVCQNNNGLLLIHRQMIQLIIK